MQTMHTHVRFRNKTDLTCWNCISIEDGILLEDVGMV